MKLPPIEMVWTGGEGLVYHISSRTFPTDTQLRDISSQLRYTLSISPLLSLSISPLHTLFISPSLLDSSSHTHLHSWSHFLWLVGFFFLPVLWLFSLFYIKKINFCNHTVCLGSVFSYTTRFGYLVYI